MCCRQQIQGLWEEGRRYPGDQIIDVQQGELLCPLCSRLANTMLPAGQLTTYTVQVPVASASQQQQHQQQQQEQQPSANQEVQLPPDNQSTLGYVLGAMQSALFPRTTATPCTESQTSGAGPATASAAAAAAAGSSSAGLAGNREAAQPPHIQSSVIAPPRQSIRTPLPPQLKVLLSMKLTSIASAEDVLAVCEACGIAEKGPSEWSTLLLNQDQMSALQARLTSQQYAVARMLADVWYQHPEVAQHLVEWHATVQAYTVMGEHAALQQGFIKRGQALLKHAVVDLQSVMSAKVCASHCIGAL